MPSHCVHCRKEGRAVQARYEADGVPVCSAHGGIRTRPTCRGSGCLLRPSYGPKHPHQRLACQQHADPGWPNLDKPICQADLCPRRKVKSSLFCRLHDGACSGVPLLPSADLLHCASPLVVTGRQGETGTHDYVLASQLLVHGIEQLERLAASHGRAGLAFDPREPGEWQPFVSLSPPSKATGLYVLPMLVALASLITGLKVREDSVVAAFCLVDGTVLPLCSLVGLAVEAAKRLGIRTVFVAQADAERLAGRVPEGVSIKPLQHAEDLLDVEKGDGLWAVEEK